MLTKCWRCKGSIDTTKVEIVETVGLCQKCWDNSSIEQSVKTDGACSSNISPEQFVNEAPWDDTDVRPKDKVFAEVATNSLEHRIAAEVAPSATDKRIMDADYAALETRAVAQLMVDELPKKSGVDFVKLQQDNDPMMRGYFGCALQKPVDKVRLQQELVEAIYEATKNFVNTDNSEALREEVKKASVRALLNNTPIGLTKPPVEVVEKLVDDCLTRLFGPPGQSSQKSVASKA